MTDIPNVNGVVVECFGKFAAQVNGKVKLFETRGEAESAAVLDAQEDAFVQQAEAYCLSRELDIKSKMAKGRINVIVDFLAYSAGSKETTKETTEVPAVNAEPAPYAF